MRMPAQLPLLITPALSIFNPAGMTQLQDREVIAGGNVGQDQLRIHQDNGSSVDAGLLTGDGGNGGSLGFIPNAYMSWALSQKICTCRPWHGGAVWHENRV
jgi:long-subunit fatty acid transport protein